MFDPICPSKLSVLYFYINGSIKISFFVVHWEILISWNNICWQLPSGLKCDPHDAEYCDRPLGYKFFNTAKRLEEAVELI